MSPVKVCWDQLTSFHMFLLYQHCTLQHREPTQTPLNVIAWCTLLKNTAKRTSNYNGASPSSPPISLPFVAYCYTGRSQHRNYTRPAPSVGSKKGLATWDCTQHVYMLNSCSATCFCGATCIMDTKEMLLTLLLNKFVKEFNVVNLSLHEIKCCIILFSQVIWSANWNIRVADYSIRASHDNFGLLQNI